MSQAQTLATPLPANLLLDLTGNRYGMLTVLGQGLFAEPGHQGIGWVCECDCGERISVGTKPLRDGEKRSCGCTRQPAQDLSGKRVGMLQVLERAPKRPREKVAAWLCRCDCGNTVRKRTRDLQDNSRTLSCGCTQASAPVNAVPVTGPLPFDEVPAPTKRPAAAKRPALVKLGEDAQGVTYQCPCGNTPTVDRDTWRQGIKVCACHGDPILLPRADHTGERFERLTILGWAPQPAGERQSAWHCRCDCGTTRVSVYSQLVQGKLRSCGCLLNEARRRPRPRTVTIPS